MVTAVENSMGRCGIRIIILVIFLFTSLFLIKCGTNPVRPDGDFNQTIYFHTYGDSYNIRSYNLSKGISDSAEVPMGSRSSFAVAADGSRLYIGGGNPTMVLDAKSFKAIDSLPFGSIDDDGISVSPDNQYLAICGSGSGVTILNNRDYSVVYRDTNSAMHGSFTSNSKHFFASNGQVYHVDFTQKYPNASLKSFGHSIWRVIPNADGTQWYLYVSFAQDFFQLQVYDVKADSILFRTNVSPGAGDMQLSADGRYLYYTSIGTILVGVPAPQALFRIDLAHDFAIDTIRTVGLSDQNGRGISRLTLDKLALAPDGQHVVACGALIRPEFILLNSRTNLVDRCITLTTHAYIVGVSCSSSKTHMGGH